MKAGQASQTAVMVCMARALAHENTTELRFSDPAALVLLRGREKARVERQRAGVKADLWERVGRAFLERRSKMMIPRTVAIDEAIREARCPQVVILGAGLDGRAFRMPELENSIVFEVDHPDSQRDKRSRAESLSPRAKELRYVPVDFTRDALGDALAGAGHDATLPTTWVWEGVVMYLTRADVESSLAVLRERSSPRSRLVILYLAPASFTPLVGLLVRRLGEPVRSAFTAEEMAQTLGRFRFHVLADHGLPEIGGAMSPDIAQATRMMKHLRIVVAEPSGQDAVAPTPSCDMRSAFRE
jgi:methyltransferase (TIGR00027 family)